VQRPATDCLHRPAGIRPRAAPRGAHAHQRARPAAQCQRLHFAAGGGDLETVRALLDAGADPLDDADDARVGVIGWATFIADQRHIPMDVVALLLERGARPARPAPAPVTSAAAALAATIHSAIPVVGARNVAATLEWYTSSGFTEVARYPTEGPTVFWGMVTFGKAELTFDVREQPDPRGVSLLLEMDRVRDLHEFLTSRQLEAADVEFVRTLHEPEHGGLEFSIRDPNGFTLRFLQPQK
jgi:ankyrin repeat protein